MSYILPKEQLLIGQIFDLHLTQINTGISQSDISITEYVYKHFLIRDNLYEYQIRLCDMREVVSVSVTEMLRRTPSS